jgi:cyanophycinase-like exopeptidase
VSGLVVLLGGQEHTPGCERIDRRLLRESGVRRPEVAVLLAASPPRRRAFKLAQARRYWRQLGARARCAFTGEGDPIAWATGLLEEADLVVLTGGRPWLLRRWLQPTGLDALLRTRWEAGVPISGSSAGAMMLAASTWALRPRAPFALRPALGLVPGVLVAPHAGRHGIDHWAARTQAAHPHLDVLGIADQTAVVVQGGQREVVGPGTVQRYGMELQPAAVATC